MCFMKNQEGVATVHTKLFNSFNSWSCSKLLKHVILLDKCIVFSSKLKEKKYLTEKNIVGKLKKKTFLFFFKVHLS